MEKKELYTQSGGIYEPLKVSFAIEVNDSPQNSVINAIVLTLFNFKTSYDFDRSLADVKQRNRQIENMKRLLDCLKVEIEVGDE